MKLNPKLKEKIMEPLGDGVGVQIAKTRKIVPAIVIGFAMPMMISRIHKTRFLSALKQSVFPLGIKKVIRRIHIWLLWKRIPDCFFTIFQKKESGQCFT